MAPQNNREKPKSYFWEMWDSFWYRAPSMEKTDEEWSDREPSTNIGGNPHWYLQRKKKKKGDK